MTKPLTRLCKRMIDVIGAALGLAAFALPMVVIALAIRVTMGGPVLFRQRRPGLHGEPFTMLKFRTMTNRRDASGRLLPAAERLTRLGRWLRKTSLDELPELWNVLRGDMSLVGPRPLLLDYLPLYTKEQARRHEVLPGITGWAQINGRNAITWEEKFRLDVWYVDHQSLGLDLKILWLTLLKVFKMEGVSPPGGIIMERFSGSKEPHHRHGGR